MRDYVRIINFRIIIIIIIITCANLVHYRPGGFWLTCDAIFLHMKLQNMLKINAQR